VDGDAKYVVRVLCCVETPSPAKTSLSSAGDQSLQPCTSTLSIAQARRQRGVGVLAFRGRRVLCALVAAATLGCGVSGSGGAHRFVFYVGGCVHLGCPRVSARALSAGFPPFPFVFLSRHNYSCPLPQSLARWTPRSITSIGVIVSGRTVRVAPILRRQICSLKWNISRERRPIEGNIEARFPSPLPFCVDSLTWSSPLFTDSILDSSAGCSRRCRIVRWRRLSVHAQNDTGSWGADFTGDGCSCFRLYALPTWG